MIIISYKVSKLSDKFFILKIRKIGLCKKGGAVIWANCRRHAIYEYLLWAIFITLKYLTFSHFSQPHQLKKSSCALWETKSAQMFKKVFYVLENIFSQIYSYVTYLMKNNASIFMHNERVLSKMFISNRL